MLQSYNTSRLLFYLGGLHAAAAQTHRAFLDFTREMTCLQLQLFSHTNFSSASGLSSSSPILQIN